MRASVDEKRQANVLKNKSFKQSRTLLRDIKIKIPPPEDNLFIDIEKLLNIHGKYYSTQTRKSIKRSKITCFRETDLLQRIRKYLSRENARSFKNTSTRFYRKSTFLLCEQNIFEKLLKRICQFRRAWDWSSDAEEIASLKKKKVFMSVSFASVKNVGFIFARQILPT